MALTGKTFCGMMVSGANALANEKEAINRLNVFPVPDGDTGTNMSLTMKGIRLAFPSFVGPLNRATDRAADLLLRNAHGNSGVILSLFFRGISKELKENETATIPEFAAALRNGVKVAYKSVMKPTEGTVLTVMRVTSEVAEAKAPLFKDDWTAFFRQLSETAEETLAKTPDLLPVLRQAGLVDAGGRGFCTVLGGMLSYLEGNPVALHEESDAEEAPVAFEQFKTEDIIYPYCTECIVTKSAKFRGEGKAEVFHQFVLRAGDSAVFVDDDDIIKVHVHTSDPGKVLSEALRYGSLLTVKVENMREQHSALLEETPAEEEHEAEPTKEYGFVAVANGDGIVQTLKDLGVDEMVIGGQTMNPSTDDLLSAIRKTPAKTVFVYPNNSNIYMVAAQAAKLEKEKRVEVIRTVSVPQGVSALLAFDETASPDENRAAMEEAIRNVSTLSMTFAARDSVFDGMEIKENQLLGLVENKVKYITDTREECIDRFCDELREKYVITVFAGSDTSDEERQAVLAQMRDRLPDAEITLVDGGQPVYFYLISAE